MKSPRVFFKFAALFITLQQSMIHAFAQPSTPRDSTWITNGNVNAVAYSKGLTYIGGDFTFVGPNTGCGAALSTTTGAPDIKFPRVNGPIYVVTPDGADGWYIGGNFTSIGGQQRNGLAALNATTGQATAWNPDAANIVRALAGTQR
jgi:hypothetical protein